MARRTGNGGHKIPRGMKIAAEVSEPGISKRLARVSYMENFHEKSHLTA